EREGEGRRRRGDRELLRACAVALRARSGVGDVARAVARGLSSRVTLRQAERDAIEERAARARDEASDARMRRAFGSDELENLIERISGAARGSAELGGDHGRSAIARPQPIDEEPGDERALDADETFEAVTRARNDDDRAVEDGRRDRARAVALDRERPIARELRAGVRPRDRSAFSVENAPPGNRSALSFGIGRALEGPVGAEEVVRQGRVGILDGDEVAQEIEEEEREDERDDEKRAGDERLAHLLGRERARDIRPADEELLAALSIAVTLLS